MVDASKNRSRVSQREARSFSRKRAVAACRSCRFRKIKCDNARPTCSSCQASEANCVYEQYPDASKFDPASLMILEKLDHIQRSLDSQALQKPPISSPRIDNIETDRGSLKPELSKSLEFLKIPAASICPGTILSWPIFRQGPGTVEFNDCYLETQKPDVHDLGQVDGSSLNLTNMPTLINSFLEHVHVKNPVLDIAFLYRSARTIADNGLSWDGASCLVLLACALGHLAGPLTFRDRAVENATQPLYDEEMIFYQEALKRISLPTDGLLTAQCWFFSGVYQMYKLNPWTAWVHFTHASASLSLRLRSKILCGNSETLLLEPDELCLYWTCWKSESDLRAELPVPDSVLSDFKVSSLHPMPPQTGYFSQTELTADPDYSPQPGLLHKYKVAWYYYLSDVTLKRIEAQILNTFYGNSKTQWHSSELTQMIHLAETFECQIDDWFKSLPSIIRFEEWDEAPREELVYNLQARTLELRSWLYRPFVYYAIHNNPEETDLADLERLLQKAIECCFHVIQSKAATHRHHGTWFMGRMVLSSALLILAAVKTRRLVEYLLDWPDLVSQAVDSLAHWALEAPDLARGAQILGRLRDCVLEDKSD